MRDPLIIRFPNGEHGGTRYPGDGPVVQFWYVPEGATDDGAPQLDEEAVEKLKSFGYF